MSTYLDEIVAHHRAMAAADPRDLDDLIEEAVASAEVVRPLVVPADAIGVIAEFKRRSPSKGSLADAPEPGLVARDYVSGGAMAISVLTDERYFGGSVDDLGVVRAATPVPVLRKDFVVSPADVCDTRLMGADIMLLIVAAVTDEELAEFHALARLLTLEVLVEVHDEDELHRALAIGARLVGVNQRDLETFDVDPTRAVRLGKLLPDDVVGIAESGIGGPRDVPRLAEAGYRGVLVGEHLMRAVDRVGAVRELAMAP